MVRFLPAFLALAVAATVDSDELTITPIAHAAVHLTDGRSALLVDFPYEAGAYFAQWKAETVPAGPKALCLVTHAHRDHFVPELANRYCAAVVGPKEVAGAVQLKSFEPGAPVQWDGITIDPIATPHGTIEHYSYLLHWRGASLFFSGDAQSPEAVLALRKVDAAFLTPSLLMAVHKSGATVDAASIVSYHHRPDDPVPNVLGRIASVPGQALKIEIKDR